VEYEDLFLYNDDDLAEHIGKPKKAENREQRTENRSKKKIEKEKPVAPPPEEEKKQVEYMEFYEAREIEKIIEHLEKLGLDVEDYDGTEEDAKEEKAKKKDTRKPKYQIRVEKEKHVFFNLIDILNFAKDSGKKGMAVQRYKGLGEMNPGQLWETTMNPDTRTMSKVVLEDAVVADAMFTVLMGEAVEPRREFIKKHAHEVKVLDI